MTIHEWYEVIKAGAVIAFVVLAVIVVVRSMMVDKSAVKARDVMRERHDLFTARIQREIEDAKGRYK